MGLCLLTPGWLSEPCTAASSHQHLWHRRQRPRPHFGVQLGRNYQDSLATIRDRGCIRLCPPRDALARVNDCYAELDRVGANATALEFTQSPVRSTSPCNAGGSLALPSEAELSKQIWSKRYRALGRALDILTARQGKIHRRSDHGNCQFDPSRFVAIRKTPTAATIIAAAPGETVGIKRVVAESIGDVPDRQESKRILAHHKPRAIRTKKIPKYIISSPSTLNITSKPPQVTDPLRGQNLRHRGPVQSRGVCSHAADRSGKPALHS